MGYAAALKKVQAIKPKENLMLVTLSYDKKLVLPHKDGLALMASLANAESLVSEWGKKPRIEPLEKDSITATLLSREGYQDIQMAHLLGITLDELKAVAEAQA